MRLIVLLIILAGVIYYQSSGSFSSGSGLHDVHSGFKGLPGKVLVPEEPVQQALVPVKSLNFKGAQIRLTHRFNVQGLVLSRKHYRVGTESKYSKVDLALGWGAMSNPNPLRMIKISQSNRFYHFRYEHAPPMPHRTIENSSANMHMIGATPEIDKKLKSVKQGDVVKINGYLAHIKQGNGWQWRSSTSRNDVGSGACELVYVNAIEIIRY